MDEAELAISAADTDHAAPSTVVMSLAGRAGIADCAWLRELLELQAERRPSRLVVDLSRLTSMDWWVALILVWFGRMIDRRGGTLVLASPQPAVARLLNATDGRAVRVAAGLRWESQSARETAPLVPDK